MGDMADMERDRCLDDDDFENFLEVSFNRPDPTRSVWVTREGVRVPIVKMSNRHLLNTIRMLRRKGIGEREPGTPFFDTMLKVARKRKLTK
jgi:hypothetical protein